MSITYTNKRFWKRLLIAVQIIAVVIGALAESRMVMHPPMPALLLANVSTAFHYAAPSAPTTPIEWNSTKRMQVRMERNARRPIATSLALEIHRARASLLERTVTVNFTDASGSTIDTLQPWTVSLGEHPDWIGWSLEGSSMEMFLRDQAVRTYLDEHLGNILPMPKDAAVISIKQGTLPRAIVSGTPEDGYTLNVQDASDKIVTALLGDQNEIAIDVRPTHGVLFAATTQGMKKYELLSRGKSDYAHSPAGRSANIEKAMTDHINGAIIAPNGTFRFNDYLDGPVSHQNGWFDSLIIVNGHDLVPAPGGGICQAATTVFRAAALAGLPIIQRANHSLYVTYYERYGVGMDATIYPGKQDLVFRNDTPANIVVLARTEGTEAVVEMYGVSDQRTVELDGPHFSSGNQETFVSHGKHLDGNDIGWISRVTSKDGTKREDVFVSSYTALPRSLQGRLIEKVGNALLF